MMKKATFLLTATFALAMTNATAQTMDDTPTHSKHIKAVDEYLPAPGQFVNTLPECDANDTPAIMAAKCTNMIGGGATDFITLGAYGGYVTFHFDHSIANIEGEPDLYIKGNAYSGNSEPGIVMVSKDTNGNGLPDDTWYEIAGSADTDSVGKVVFNYEITYSPNSLGNISWTDNQGNSGTVDRNTFHAQEYFPLWHEGPLTFKGTLLPKNAVNTSKTATEHWVMDSFRYGYVDNAANTDTLGCSIDISWAVDQDRQPVKLDFVDFVRVYNGENQKCGWIGETSTEVGGAEDLHLDKSIEAIKASLAGITQAVETTRVRETGRYGIDGRRITSQQRGIVIVRYSDGTTKKVKY